MREDINMKKKKNTDPKELYKSGDLYGTVSPKELYKSGDLYGTISPKDF